MFWRVSHVTRVLCANVFPELPLLLLFWRSLDLRQFHALCILNSLHIICLVFFVDKKKKLVYSHTKVSTCVQGSPHLGQRSWLPPLPDPPEPDSLFPSLMLFCIKMTASAYIKLHHYNLSHVQIGGQNSHGKEVQMRFILYLSTIASTLLCCPIFRGIADSSLWKRPHPYLGR